jgi:hypothetical protein
MTYYTMTNNDYAEFTPSEYAENFDGYESYDDAEDEAIAELMVDDDDTTFQTFIVDDTGNIHAKVWMTNGDVWVHRTDDLPYSPLCYDDTF